MSFIFNGTAIDTLIFNGTNIDRLIIDGTTVWESFSTPDFEFTSNGDGTFTITRWKGTYNGTASTECIIPDDSRLIV